MAKDDEAEEQAEGEGRHDEEVDGHDVASVGVQKRSPRRRQASGGPARVLGHREGGHLITEKPEFGLDPAPPPGGVLQGHAAD